MMDYLDVYLHEKKVGVLSSDKGKMEFTYSPEYLNQPDAEPLAYTLPLSSAPYSGGNVVSFFSNLLPDESVRIRIAEILNVSPENMIFPSSDLYCGLPLLFGLQIGFALLMHIWSCDSSVPAGRIPSARFRRYLTLRYMS